MARWVYVLPQVAEQIGGSGKAMNEEKAIELLKMFVAICPLTQTGWEAYECRYCHGQPIGYNDPSYAKHREDCFYAKVARFLQEARP